MSTQSWADYHGKAIDEALAGARGRWAGTTVRRFQLALQESAFANHFLQDSFAAGHMGFNRTASSAAASKSFHDAWNDRGRIVSDRNGDRWVTFGDGWLNRPENEGGRRHVQAAATMSVRNVLRAFVLGERDPEEELALWRALPFTIQAPETERRRDGAVFAQRRARRPPARPAAQDNPAGAQGHRVHGAPVVGGDVLRGG